MRTNRLLALLWALGALGCSDSVNTAPDFAKARPPVDNPDVDVPQARQPFIVTLEPKANPSEVARDHGVQPRFVYTNVMNGFAGSISEAARSGLLRDARVVRVDRDQVFSTDGSGTQTGATWGLDRIDQRTLPMDSTYSYAATGRGVTVYIVDTGIRYTHVEFGGRASFGFDAFGGNGSDCVGHGTHVAGTTGGSKYGVAKEANLVSVRVLDCAGSGTTSTVVAGLDWIVGHASRPAVANLSLIGDPDDLLDAAISRTIGAGVAVVVAAGNSTSDACLYSPARVNDAITVGATSPYDKQASFSNFGSCVDWYAPGMGIMSAGYVADTAVAYMSGTSMAAPHTTGVAALYLEVSPSATPLQVRAALGDWTTKKAVDVWALKGQAGSADLLYAGGSGGGSTPVNTPPSASFTVSCAGLTCAFTDQSADPDGTIASWSWTFGDQGSSASQSPSHAYAAAGTYRVTLAVTDNAGATGSRSVDVTATDPTLPPPSNAAPVASFTVTCTNLACAFTDTSTDGDGTLASWAWSFGDQATSGTQNPAHAYAGTGTYRVTLVVTDNGGASASVSRDVAVSAPANAPPTAGFAASCSRLACQFTDQSADPDGTIRVWDWSFGDGAGASFQVSSTGTAHTFTGGSVYQVSLTVTDDAGAKTTTAQKLAVGPVLTVTGSKLKGKATLNLRWTGVESSKVDVYLNGSRLMTVDNTGASTYLTSDRGQVTYRVRICEAGTTVCSLEQTVTL